jgi:hypothetical protein
MLNLQEAKMARLRTVKVKRKRQNRILSTFPEASL